MCVQGKYFQTFPRGLNRRRRLCPETTNLHHPFTLGKQSLLTSNHAKSITTRLIIVFSHSDSNKNIYSILTLNRPDQSMDSTNNDILIVPDLEYMSPGAKNNFI